MDDEETCREPADSQGWFFCQKRPNHYGERHYVDFGVGDYAWDFVPFPEDDDDEEKE